MSTHNYTDEELAQWQEAVDKMKEFIDEIDGFAFTITPDLYGPLSYQYYIGIVDGKQQGTMFTVINDATRLGTWVPKVGDAVADGWRHEFTWMDLDTARVKTVERQEIEQVVAARQALKNIQGGKGVIDLLSKKDFDTIKAAMDSLLAANKALNPVAPAADQGVENVKSLKTFVSDNWSGDAANAFLTLADDLRDGFDDLGEAIESLFDANDGLMGVIMEFITALMEVCDIRSEEANEYLSNVAGGLLGVLLGPADALAWLELAYSVVDTAGEPDSEDRREAMNDFNNTRAAGAMREAENDARVDWPTFPLPAFNFGV